MEGYILGIDQSTQSTKAVLFDENGNVCAYKQIEHRQFVDENGWVSHDMLEIYDNCIKAVKELVACDRMYATNIKCIAITNQRESTGMWDKITGTPFDRAVVWQCSRAADICEREDIKNNKEYIRKVTGLCLSPYYPAAKLAWLIENNSNIKAAKDKNNVCAGTMDSWLIFKLTKGKVFKTDISNASRSQLFDIRNEKWDEHLCDIFGVNINMLPQVCDSDSFFGETDMEGILSDGVPIMSVMGDSHAALFGEGCINKGMAKVTYGTGSSIMLNTGDNIVVSKSGLSLTIAWKRNGKTVYALEGNINYTGAVITWLKDDLKLISSASDTGKIAQAAVKDDGLYLIPAFTGLGAPYWYDKAKAQIVGIDRTTGKNEIVRAALECIAYQISDVLLAMEKDTDCKTDNLYADGGPAQNEYLMQFQSDILQRNVAVPEMKMLSAMGTAYMAGINIGLYSEDILTDTKNMTIYSPKINEHTCNRKYNGWKNNINRLKDCFANG